jgi:hypothetical protein
MGGRHRGGTGPRGEQGQGRDGQGPHSMGKFTPAEMTGYCVCPQYDRKGPHEEGTPCMQHMTRQ